MCRSMPVRPKLLPCRDIMPPGAMVVERPTRLLPCRDILLPPGAMVLLRSFAFRSMERAKLLLLLSCRAMLAGEIATLRGDAPPPSPCCRGAGPAGSTAASERGVRGLTSGSALGSVDMRAEERLFLKKATIGLVDSEDPDMAKKGGGVNNDHHTRAHTPVQLVLYVTCVERFG